MSDIVLQAEGITKSFSYPARLELLKGINLTVAEKESVAIRGKSGEGKTSLLHILGTLDDPTEGTLRICGQDVRTHNRDLLRNRHIGFVFQAFHLLEDATVMDNILLPLHIARRPIHQRSENYHKAELLLQKLGLYERRHLQALKLSGGEKQRLSIGRAFITNPDILFADEPTGNLDHETSAVIEDLLFSWAAVEGKALIVVTHSQNLASRCSLCYVLENGLLIS